MQCIHCGAINLKEDTICVDCGKDIYEFINQSTNVTEADQSEKSSLYAKNGKVVIISPPGQLKNSKFPYSRLLTFSIVILFTIVPLFFINSPKSVPDKGKKELADIMQAPVKQMEQDVQANDSLTEAEKVMMIKEIKERAAEIKTMDTANIMGSALEEIKKAKTMQIRSALLSYYSQNNIFPDTLSELYPDYTREEPKDWLEYKVDTSKTSFSLEFELSAKYKGSHDFVFEEGDKKIFRMTGAY